MSGLNGNQAAEVLVHLEQGGHLDVDLCHLWDQVLQRGWLDPTEATIIVRTGHKRFSLFVERTAFMLTDYLRQRLPQVQVLYMPSNVMFDIRAAKQGGTYEKGNKRNGLRLLSCCLRDGLPLQETWLLPFSLVTVSGVGPDWLLGVSSVMDVQAEPMLLSSITRLLLRKETLYEAHRVIRSDVAVVCSHISRGRPEKGSFWAVSNSDIALEASIGSAAGLVPRRLPHLKYLSQHETVDWDKMQKKCALPRLRGYNAPAIISICLGAALSFVRGLFLLANQLYRIGSNIDRLAAAMKKRFNLI